jgi:hypothetical protein
MSQEIIYSEKQRFTQWWVWAILVVVNGLMLFGVLQQLIFGRQFGDTLMNNTALVIVAAVSIGLSSLIFIFRLETEITRDGINVRFFPFISSRHYPWHQISRSFVRKYSPLAEYGGWGIRFGFFGKGTAFNVSGDQGLQLIFIDDKKLLIGTGKPEELTEALIRIGHYTA